ncbi:hypothetical protein [Streptomyces sp. CLI2509]|uniref:hypothetical protein n=1 Tax=Streptomyces sp. CLI2509 TaxID=1984801 RepID=UPI000BACC50E|nr:hypothetical protein [Streptomyces sp. CLI2509]ASY37026.1 hypothetical protein CAC01_30785 [Streptomyces sp. CLI2509]MYX23035.1 hypothetical protein [Streptomyces sp. SID8380]
MHSAALTSTEIRIPTPYEPEPVTLVRACAGRLFLRRFASVLSALERLEPRLPGVRLLDSAMNGNGPYVIVWDRVPVTAARA